MIFSAVATLVFLSALATGTSDTMIRNSTGLYSGQVTAFGLPQGMDPAELKSEGVTAVLPRHSGPGILRNRGSMATVELVGVNLFEERKFSGLWRKKVSGGYPETMEAGLFIGQDLADRLNVSPGEEIQFQNHLNGRGTGFTVSGIFKTGLHNFDGNMAFCSMDALPFNNGQRTAALFLVEGRDPHKLITRYRARLSQEITFKTWDQLMPDLRQLIHMNQICMAIVNAIVFGIVSLGVACAFVIFILKNIREYGLMKSMGVTHTEIAGLIASEILIMNLFASLAGLLGGILLVWAFSGTGIDISQFTSYNRYFVVSGVIYPRLTPTSIFVPPGLALLFSTGAGIWPAIIVLRQSPAQILREI
jgi:ABC-type lipoprotein release transport system permease subunit